MGKNSDQISVNLSRWYLYFHERILGQLIGDPTFTLPFWNWDSAAGRAIPAPFLDKTSPIYNANRNNLNSLTSQVKNASGKLVDLF